MHRRVLARRARIAAGVALALALVALVGLLFAVTWRPSPRAFPVQGVDVGEAQGTIDWFALRRRGVAFAYVRATDGAERRDTRFAENWRGAYAAGVARGAVHEFSLCRLASDQARNFVTTVPRDAAQLPMALALSFAPGCAARPDRAVLLAEIREFLAAVEGHLGRRAILRITADFEAAYRVSAAIPRPLWSIGQFSPPYYLARPWTLWRANRFRRVEGVDAPVPWTVKAPDP